MTRLAAQWRLPMGMEKAWPEELRPADPFSGDEGLADPASYEQYCAWVRPSLLDADHFRTLDDAFLDTYFKVLAGELPWGSTDEMAHELVIDHPLRHDKRPSRPSIAPLSDDVLCDLTEDWVPGLGVVAPPRVVGPWSMLDLPRRVRIASGASMACTPLFPPSIRPMSRPCRTKPKAAPEVRSALIAVLRSPAMVWTPTPDGGLEALMPLARRSRPEGPVAGVPDAPAVVGRVVALVDGGWFLSCGLPLSSVPDAAVLTRRMVLEYRRLRRHDRRMTWEDLLRDRGELVARTACEWLWMNAPDQVMSTWERWAEGWSAAPRVVPPRNKRVQKA